MRPIRAAIAASCSSLLLLAAPSAAAQQLEALSVGLRRPEAAGAARPTASPTGLGLTARSIAWAVWGASGGGAVGGMIDSRICDRRHPRSKHEFLPCLMYAGGPTAIGWFGGSLAGATVGASRAARKRGCPTGAAIARAFLGAGVGVLPGSLAAAHAHGHFPPRRSALIFTAPIASGAGAALATVGCRSPAMTAGPNA